METPNNKRKSRLLELHLSKSEGSIKQINQLHKALTNLEQKCNKNIAHKYLVGFLEEKGVKSYEEYINSLV